MVDFVVRGNVVHTEKVIRNYGLDELKPWIDNTKA